MHKIIAYLLIVIGLALMCFAFTGMYQTFVNKKPVAQLVNAQPLSINTNGMKMQFDSVVIIQVFNISLFALFMMFLVVLGMNIVKIGNSILKTERICETLEKLHLQGGTTPNEQELKKL